MLKKAINHVIQVKRKDKKLDEALKKKGYGYYLVFLEKRKESRSFYVFLGEKCGEKREKKCLKTPKTTPKNPLFQFWSKLGC